MLKRFRSAIGPAVYKAAARGPLTAPARLALRGFGRQVVPAVSYAIAADRRGKIFEESTSTISSPRSVSDSTDGSLQRQVTARRSLGWYEVKNCVVSAYSPAALNSSGILLPQDLAENLGLHLTDSDGIFSLHDGICFTSEPRSSFTELEHAIHCGGAGAFNYYHFGMECVPQAWLSGIQDSEFHDVPLILPSEARTIPQFSQWLDIWAHDRPKIYLRRGEYVHVRRLIRFDELSYGPYNMPAGKWPSSCDYRNHDQAMALYLSSCVDRLLGSSSAADACEKIFIVRPENRRKYNQDVLVDIAKAQGFSCISPELLGIREQALLFNSAKFIIGASGAAWLSLAYCREGTKALSWLPKQYDGFCAYSTLAQTVGVDLRFIWSSYPQPLRSTGDAYTSSYIVEPESFRLALARMLAGYP